ncbi:MAG: flagellar basal body-associated FliL family protein [Spongiibacteraceae bacterium]|jgi:flagellar FliL protein|nr:flagellar basal body-associated FliL family protein [Spongiibacteraceae bacterium]
MASWKQRLLGALVLLLIGAVGGAGVTYGAMQQGWFDASPAADLPEESVEQPAVFHTLDRLIIGLAAARGQRYMVLDLALIGRDADFASQSDTLAPLIQNAVLRYFSRHDYAMAMEESRDPEALQERLLEQIRSTVADNGHELAVEKVLLTKVVIQ